MNSEREKTEAAQRSETERDRHSEMISTMSSLRGNSGGSDENNNNPGRPSTKSSK